MVEIKNISLKGKKMMADTEQCRNLIGDVKKEIDDIGFKSLVKPIARYKSCAINIGDIRLSQKYVDQYGHNISAWSGRRGRILNWNQWIDLNNSMNNILDQKNLSADIKSLGGRFIIRDKITGRKSEEDWEHLENENVGSEMRPVARVDLWTAER